MRQNEIRILNPESYFKFDNKSEIRWLNQVPYFHFREWPLCFLRAQVVTSGTALV